MLYKNLPFLPFNHYKMSASSKTLQIGCSVYTIFIFHRLNLNDCKKFRHIKWNLIDTKCFQVNICVLCA